MTNEELAAAIQGGQREKLPELWAQVERYVAVQAQRRLILAGDFGGVTIEDLCQSGYLALVAAVDGFDPAAGKSFIGWLALHLKTAFAEAGGYRSRKQARDPLHRAGSLDAPLDGEADGDPAAALVEDPGASQAFQDAEERMWREQLHEVLETALGTLPADQSSTLRRRYYDGQTMDEIAAADGVYKETVRQRQNKALRALRQSKGSRQLRQFIELRTPYYLRVGADTFTRTGYSAVERIVQEREQLRYSVTGGSETGPLQKNQESENKKL